MPDVQSHVVASRDGLDPVVDAIVVHGGDLMYTLRLDLTTIIRNGPRATREDFITLALSYLTAVSIDASATLGAGSVPTGDAVLLRYNPLLDIHNVFYGSVTLTADTYVAIAIAKAVADIIRDVSSSHPLALHVVNVPSFARTEDVRPSAVG